MAVQVALEFFERNLAVAAAHRRHDRAGGLLRTTFRLRRSLAINDLLAFGSNLEVALPIFRVFFSPLFLEPCF